MSRQGRPNRMKALVGHPRFPAVVAALLGSLFALLLPAYSGPDENGHVAYVAALAQGHLPVMPAQFTADTSTGTTWQAQQPPLFYLLATPLYLACGADPATGLYALRLLGVGCFGLVVLLVGRLGRSLLSPAAAHAAALLVAAHPLAVYVSAMANNEAVAVALSLACIWTGVEASRAPRRYRWLLLTCVIAGLGLLAKLTALPGVVVAAAVAGQGRPLSSRMATAGAVLAGALAFWMPWGLLMQKMHGSFVPSAAYRPLFPGGWDAMALFPQDAFVFANMTLAQFALGLLGPVWIAQTPYLPACLTNQGCGFSCDLHCYSLLGCGWVISAWIIYRIQAHWSLWCAAVCFFGLYAIVLGAVFFRDWHVMQFAARYVPAALPLVALLAIADYHRLRPRARAALAAAWTAVVAFEIGYIFYFFIFR